MKMETIVLHRGYCVKSPPVMTHRWHRRWCTLSIVKIPSVEEFYQKYYKKSRCRDSVDDVFPLSDLQVSLVFSYYENEDQEMKDKSINRFIIDNSVITDHHEEEGTHGYKHAIRMHLPPVYNSRVLFLCFDDEMDHQHWLQSFKYYMNLLEGRSKSLYVMSHVLDNRVKSCLDPFLQQEVQKFVTLERKGKEKGEQGSEDHP